MINKLYRSFGFNDFYHLPVTFNTGASKSNTVFSVAIKKADTEALGRQVALNDDKLYRLAIRLGATIIGNENYGTDE